MDGLSELHWKMRAVLVFGEAGDPRIDRQIKLLLGKKTELKDRDLVLIRVSGEDTEVVYGDWTAPSGPPFVKRLNFTAASTSFWSARMAG